MFSSLNIDSDIDLKLSFIKLCTGRWYNMTAKFSCILFAYCTLKKREFFLCLLICFS